MTERDQHLLEIRPFISTAKISDNTGTEELFQNKTLRPVIKLQNDLLLEAFRNYIQKHKNVFYDYSIERRLTYITNSIQKDIKFRNSLKGMIIGQFTVEEYRNYIKNSSALNKRMMNLVTERIKSNIQLLEQIPVV